MQTIIVIAGSAGSFDPIRQILDGLPNPCSASIFIVMHIGAGPSVLAPLLNQEARLPVAFARDSQVIEPGRVYVAPPDHHMTLVPGHIRLSDGSKVHHTRPAADPLFISAARFYGSDVMGIVLSGGDGDGAEGLKMIKEFGGKAFVQRPDQAAQPSMPLAALAADHPDAMLSITDIAAHIRAFCT